MNSISFSSKIMNLVCSFFLGATDKIGMPQDFYYRVTDRYIPPPNQDDWRQQRNRLFVNLSRQNATWSLMKMVAIFNITIFSVLFVVLMLIPHLSR